MPARRSPDGALVPPENRCPASGFPISRVQMPNPMPKCRCDQGVKHALCGPKRGKSEPPPRRDLIRVAERGAAPVDPTDLGAQGPSRGSPERPPRALRDEAQLRREPRRPRSPSAAVVLHVAQRRRSESSSAAIATPPQVKGRVQVLRRSAIPGARVPWTPRQLLAPRGSPPEPRARSPGSEPVHGPGQ
ncbi:hypothetical protein NDU88_001804 [Pleurodeles waltl]|uniref:Uncharacterized protein n=1 Tax=Pleurodeles waltl TaxID=8319 RepID=A0AAV7TJS2_PLEWA|nr:hypothetical protein NDU88_001804 [Pleurodeles waltl]